jgi:hypothetical protein
MCGVSRNGKKGGREREERREKALPIMTGPRRQYKSNYYEPLRL